MNGRGRSPVRAWMVWSALAAVVVVAAVLSTRFLSIEAVQAAESSDTFDPAAYADERFEADIVPAITSDAIDLVTLLQDLDAGDDPADFGNTPGTGSSYSFPVEFTGVLGAPNASLAPITVTGVPAGTQVQVQVGPALNGTALRDVTGTVSFNDFTNQLEFQQVATEFNDIVRDTTLADVDPATLEGRTVHVIGAFTRINPDLVSVVPVVFEVQE